MSSKSIVISGIILLLVALGGYVLYSLGSEPMNEPLNPLADQEQVQAQEVVTGEGAEAVPGARVSILYVGQLTDGTVFDSSEAHGNEPLTFVLGEPGLIPGFQIGVNGMREGGERIIAIPPALGYGDQAITDEQGNVIIPANSTLVFNIRLVAVTPAATPEAQ